MKIQNKITKEYSINDNAKTRKSMKCSWCNAEFSRKYTWKRHILMSEECLRSPKNVARLSYVDLEELANSEAGTLKPRSTPDLFDITMHFFKRSEQIKLKEKYRTLAQKYIQLYTQTQGVNENEDFKLVQEWDLSMTSDPDFPTFLGILKAEHYVVTQVISTYIYETFRGQLMITVNDKTRGTFTIQTEDGLVRVGNEFIISELFEAIIARVQEHIKTFMRLSAELYMSTPETLITDITSVEHLYTLKQFNVKVATKDIDRLRLIKKMSDDIPNVKHKKFIACAVSAFIKLQDNFKNKTLRDREAFTLALKGDLALL